MLFAKIVLVIAGCLLAMVAGRISVEHETGEASGKGFLFSAALSLCCCFAAALL